MKIADGDPCEQSGAKERLAIVLLVYNSKI